MRVFSLVCLCNGFMGSIIFFSKMVHPLFFYYKAKIGRGAIWFMRDLKISGRSMMQEIKKAFEALLTAVRQDLSLNQDAPSGGSSSDTFEMEMSLIGETAKVTQREIPSSAIRKIERLIKKGDVFQAIDVDTMSTPLAEGLIDQVKAFCDELEGELKGELEGESERKLEGESEGELEVTKKPPADNLQSKIQVVRKAIAERNSLFAQALTRARSKADPEAEVGVSEAAEAGGGGAAEAGGGGAASIPDQQAALLAQAADAMAYRFLQMHKMWYEVNDKGVLNSSKVALGRDLPRIMKYSGAQMAATLIAGLRCPFDKVKGTTLVQRMEIFKGVRKVDQEQLSRVLRGDSDQCAQLLDLFQRFNVDFLRVKAKAFQGDINSQVLGEMLKAYSDEKIQMQELVGLDSESSKQGTEQEHANLVNLFFRTNPYDRKFCVFFMRSKERALNGIQVKGASQVSVLSEIFRAAALTEEEGADASEAAEQSSAEQKFMAAKKQLNKLCANYKTLNPDLLDSVDLYDGLTDIIDTLDAVVSATPLSRSERFMLEAGVPGLSIPAGDQSQSIKPKPFNREGVRQYLEFLRQDLDGSKSKLEEVDRELRSHFLPLFDAESAVHKARVKPKGAVGAELPPEVGLMRVRAQTARECADLVLAYDDVNKAFKELIKRKGRVDTAKDKELKQLMKQWRGQFKKEKVLGVTKLSRREKVLGLTTFVSSSIKGNRGDTQRKNIFHRLLAEQFSLLSTLDPGADADAGAGGGGAAAATDDKQPFFDKLNEAYQGVEKLHTPLLKKRVQEKGSSETTSSFVSEELKTIGPLLEAFHNRLEAVKKQDPAGAGARFSL
jgi:hypothetical protein